MLAAQRVAKAILLPCQFRFLTAPALGNSADVMIILSGRHFDD
jgi:hypothetical protein